MIGITIQLYSYYFSTTDICLELRICIFTSQINKIIYAVLYLVQILKPYWLSQISLCPIGLFHMYPCLGGAGSEKPRSPLSVVITPLRAGRLYQGLREE